MEFPGHARSGNRRPLLLHQVNTEVGLHSHRFTNHLFIAIFIAITFAILQGHRHISIPVLRIYMGSLSSYLPHLAVLNSLLSHIHPPILNGTHLLLPSATAGAGIYLCAVAIALAIATCIAVPSLLTCAAVYPSSVSVLYLGLLSFSFILPLRLLHRICGRMPLSLT